MCKEKLGGLRGVFWKASMVSVVIFSPSGFCSAKEKLEAEEVAFRELDNRASVHARFQALGEGGVAEAPAEEVKQPDSQEVEGSAALQSKLGAGIEYAYEKILPQSSEMLALGDAQQNTQVESSTGKEKGAQLHSRAEIGVNYTYLNLKPHGNFSFDGSLGGLQGFYQYRPKNCLYGEVDFAWRQGDTDGSGGDRSILYFDVQERGGYTFAFAKREALLTLFSGFAYRYIGQTLKPKHGSSLSFGYNEFYFPVGVMSGCDVKRWLSCGLNFTWMPQVYSTVSIVPLKGARWDITNTLANFLVELPLTFKLMQNERFLCVLKPSYQRWEDGHSTAKAPNGTTLGLPGNTYNFYGIDVNIGYAF